MQALLMLMISICYSLQLQAQEGPQMEQRVQTDIEIPPVLYKIISEEQFEQSQDKPNIVLDPMDNDFIHFSTKDQIAHVAGKFWKGKAYVLLAIAPAKLKGRLAYEANPGGTNLYYHLYDGSIPLDAVVDVQYVLPDMPEN